MKTIALGNDVALSLTVFQQDDPTLPRRVATGLILTALLSATPGGAAIDGSLSGLATEKIDVPGTYLAYFLGANLTLHASTYVNRIVYLCLSNGSSINQWTPVKIASSMTVPT